MKFAALAMPWRAISRMRLGSTWSRSASVLLAKRGLWPCKVAASESLRAISGRPATWLRRALLLAMMLAKASWSGRKAVKYR